MRQQRIDLAGDVRRQACQDVTLIDVRIMSVQLGRLDQAHDRRRALAGRQRAGKQPVLALMSSYT